MVQLRVDNKVLIIDPETEEEDMFLRHLMGNEVVKAEFLMKKGDYVRPRQNLHTEMREALEGLGL